MLDAKKNKINLSIVNSYNDICQIIEDRSKMIVVTKVQTVEKIKPILNLGHRFFGENRLQEAQEKWSLLKKEYNDVELHLIGNLQTNKVKDAVKLFDVIQTIDREKLAKKLKSEIDEQGKQDMSFFIQINIGNESQKTGVLPEDSSDFIAFCKNDLNLNIKGIMCIPPYHENPISYFKKIKEITASNGLSECSMGMSNDFEEAIDCGATYVRVGSKIFGSR